MEGASKPSYRISFSIPLLLDTRLYITNRRVIVVGHVLFRLFRQEFSIWQPEYAPSKDRDALNGVKTGATSWGFRYVEIISKNPTASRNWYRSEDLRFRIFTRHPESLAKTMMQKS